MKRTQSVKLDEPTKHPVNEAPTIHQNQLMSNVLLNSAFIITFITAILYFSGWTYWKTYFEQFNIELTQMAIPYHLMITTGHFKIYGVIIFAVIYIFLKKQLSKDIVNLSISLMEFNFIYLLITLLIILPFIILKNWYVFLWAGPLLLWIIISLIVDLKDNSRLPLNIFLTFLKKDSLNIVLLYFLLIALINSWCSFEALIAAHIIKKGNGIFIEAQTLEASNIHGMIIGYMNGNYFIFNKTNESDEGKIIVIKEDRLKEIKQMKRVKWIFDNNIEINNPSNNSQGY